MSSGEAYTTLDVQPEKIVEWRVIFMTQNQRE